MHCIPFSLQYLKKRFDRYFTCRSFPDSSEFGFLVNEEPVFIESEEFGVHNRRDIDTIDEKVNLSLLLLRLILTNYCSVGINWNIL